MSGPDPSFPPCLSEVYGLRRLQGFVVATLYAVIGGLFGWLAGFLLVNFAFRLGFDPRTVGLAGGIIVACTFGGAGFALAGYLRQGQL